MQAAFAFPKKCRQSISWGAASGAVTPVVSWPWPGGVLPCSALSLGAPVVLRGPQPHGTPG